MDRTFVNARSPLRLLEKGLHGGLGRGNLGVVLAGHGVGKSSFLVGVALDELLRRGTVLHVALDQTVSHVRTYYDTVFDEFASSTHLDDAAVVRSELEQRRSIRAYAPTGFNTAKLREAVKVESEAGESPTLILIDGFELAAEAQAQAADLKALAEELGAEIWLSVPCSGERVSRLPGDLHAAEDAINVILVLEPGEETVALRALKDHDNPDVSALHVALDPHTLLLVRH